MLDNFNSKIYYSIPHLSSLTVLFRNDPGGESKELRIQKLFVRRLWKLSRMEQVVRCRFFEHEVLEELYCLDIFRTFDAIIHNIFKSAKFFK